MTSFAVDDVEAVFAYASKPETSRYTTWTPHTELREARDFLQYALGERYCWAIRLEEAGDAIGAIECTAETPGENTIHYVLSPDHWGRGLMTEAAQAILTWAFETRPGVDRITTGVIESHGASRRVLEKCGMKVTGTVSETWEKFTEPVDLVAYELTREAWQASRS